MQEAFDLGHNAESTPHSVPRLVAYCLLEADFYRFQQAHSFVHEASVLHFLHSDHV